MRYVATTKSGHTIVFRNVLELDYDAKERKLVMVMPGRRFTVDGCESLKAGGDFEPWGNCMEVNNPPSGSAPTAVVASFKSPEDAPRHFETYSDRSQFTSEVISDCDSDLCEGFSKRESVVPAELIDSRSSAASMPIGDFLRAFN